MAQHPIQFHDGEAYERGMGVWSQRVGPVFLDWLNPQPGLRWLDVGCGNGAFTSLLGQRCAPTELQGIDPSEAQLVFARSRAGLGVATFHQGDAMALPFDNGRFDAAVMALVIHFVPDPAKGVAEMTRVVRPGGTVAAYVWDHMADGAPTAPFQAELSAMGVPPPEPPSAAASRMAALLDLWSGAGLKGIESRDITVERTFADFEDFWLSGIAIPVIRPAVAGMTAGNVAELKTRLSGRLPADAEGRITYSARANAIKGFVPKAA